MQIEEIEPDVIYNTSFFYNVKYPNGEPVYPDLTDGKKSGKVPYEEKGTAHLLLGKDVISFLKCEFDSIRTLEQAAQDKINSFSNKELLGILTKEKRLKKIIKNQGRRLRSVLIENKKLKEKQDLYQSREAIEEERTTTVINHINSIILDDKSVKKVDSEFICACGIYFLIKDGNVVYIGQSVNIAGRIAQHKKDDKDFNEVRFILCDKERLDAREMFFIRLLKPELNGTYKNNDHRDIYKVSMETL